MILHHSVSKDRLSYLISTNKIKLAGNKKLKIYGTLDCASGKRMNTLNRVFFGSESEAIQLGFRPCGACLTSQYKIWKKRKKQVEKRGI
jgi:methylphosphotriester-DNA--protein-cysteine methyltransferase